MNEFYALLRKEYHRSWGWAIGVLGSLGLWMLVVYAIKGNGPYARMTQQTFVLSAAFAIGVIVLCCMVGRRHAEVRQEESRFRSPISCYLRILVRVVFALGVGLVYSIGLGMLEWWVLALAGAHLGTIDVLQLTLVLPVFASFTLLMPTLGWVLLLVMFTRAYHGSRLTWLAAIAMCVGTPVTLVYKGIMKLDQFLPVWYVGPGIVRFFNQLGNSARATGERSWLMAIPRIVHSGDVVGTLVFTALVLLLAGRLWEEVEGTSWRSGGSRS